MESYILETKEELEADSCPIHNQHPKVTLTNEGDNLSIACCCEEFREQCTKDFKSYLAQILKKQSWIPLLKG